MAILPIVETPDPRLKQVSKPVEGGVTDELRAFMDDMLETMYGAPGIGLAAIQVGEPIRVLVIDLQEMPEGSDDDPEAEPIREPMYFVNPEILEVAQETKPYNEGCLSVPDQYAEIERPAWCRVKWLDYDGVEHEEKIEGFLATVIQHEMDHLEGILFIDHLSKLKRDMILKKLSKMRKAA